MNYLLFLFWIFFMILFHYLIKNDFSFIQKYLNKLFKYSPLFKEYLKKYLKTILYTFFTFIVGKTFEHLDMWVDLFFVSIWMLVDEKENINLYSSEKSKMSANCTLENCSGKQDLKENKFFKQTNLTGNFCRYFNSLRLFLYQKIIGLFKNFDIISFLFSSISVIFLMLACMSIRDISVKDINYWQKNLTADEFVKISEYAILKVVLYSCISIVFILIFISRQKKMKNPYIRLELFKNKRFMVVVVTSIFIYGIMMGTALWFPVYINRMTGAGMERAGYIMLPGAVIMAVSSVLGGWLYQKYGIRLLYAISICLFILAFITRNVVPIWVMYSFRSIGIGAIMMPMTAWGMKEIKKEYYSDGTAIICSLRTIAGALGTAIASILV